jgi:ubiquinone/menaquinone biosynthesis C-methylase UbiE
MSFTIRFDDNNQEIVFGGVMRPQAASDLDIVRETVKQAIDRVTGTLFLNFKRLNKVNNIAFHELASILTNVCKVKPQLKIRIIISSVVGWATRKFKVICAISPNIKVEQYDQDFYPGQGVLEDDGFVPILRTQTKMAWPHERHLLPKHGLREGMSVADICCGIGDFAVLLHKEFKPARLLALDHAKTSLDYARKVAADFGITDIDYVYGDASALLIEDAQFDFVTCRLALQIFNKPELILKELYRICKPGGRIYLTNESFSNCFGHPRSETIGWTYEEAAKLFAHFDMDLEFGIKMHRYLIEAGFTDLRVDSMVLTNRNTDPEAFADVVRSWEKYIAGPMAVQANRDEEFRARLQRGFQDHIYAITSPKGFAGWPIWVASATKP